MRWGDIGIAIAIGLVVGVLAGLGALGRPVLEGVDRAYGSWYLPVLVVVVGRLPVWRSTSGGTVVARVVTMVGVAWLALLVGVAVLYLFVYPLLWGRP